MSTKERLALVDAADELLAEGNAVAITMRIGGEVFSSTMKIPDTENLTDDDNIGDVGHALGHHIEILSTNAIHTFNMLVEEKKHGN